jgi:2-polyprenyl-3-methyl-5-hydroxy-6-metoxy-1,4-benzoquinol methylase
MAKMDPIERKAHWEKVYTTKSHREVSWFAEHIGTSLELIARTGVGKAGRIIDVGGGASTLVDDLLVSGYRDLTVLDISGAALKIAQARLQQDSGRVNWIVADILKSDLGKGTYDVWHDRAVFHFLTTDEERNAYKEKVAGHLNVDGFVVLSVFAADGPEKCSMLEVRRHSGTQIESFFGAGYQKTFEEHTTHATPGKAEQKFVNMILKRLG